ncbi:zf-HC2 domain-containing protein [Actinoplanes sp. NPDC051859]|uniref:zf-HC2 domain-containing protein n=1 Tax=Actinoplanes sp. NPDC051859 TaxID=3363909 RepID=UPI00378DDE04
MACERWREMLSAQLDGEDDPADRVRVDEHLTGCAGCREWLDRAAAVNRLTRTALVADVPDLTDSILAALAADRAADSTAPAAHRAADPAAPAAATSRVGRGRWNARFRDWFAVTRVEAGSDARRAVSDTRQAVGDAHQAGDVHRAVGDTRRAAGDTRRAVGDTRRAAGDTRRAAGDTRRAAGDTRRAAGGVRAAADRSWRSRAAAGLYVALAVVGAVQLILGLTQVGGGVGSSHLHTGMDATPGHLWHESAAWNVAVGAGFLFIALRRNRPTGLVPMLTAFVGMLLLLSVNDLSAARVDATRLVSHGFVILGYLIVVALSRVTSDSAQPPGNRAGRGTGWHLTQNDPDPGSDAPRTSRLRLVRPGPLTATHNPAQGRRAA